MDLVSKQLALTGRLKPEARLGLAISEFAQSLDIERRREFQCKQTAKETKISGQDVIKVTEEINQEGARRHRAWRPHGTKVGGFLSRIQTFASVGDVLIGGSQNIIATSVWSAVRLSLTMAANYLSYFEKLSTLFMKLGTSWALHEDFVQLFPRSEILQTYFFEYLVVLVKLCNKIVVFGQKKAGAQLLSSLGSSFDSEFGAIQKELDQWGCLIQQQCQILSTKMATGAEERKIHSLKQRILRRLSPHQGDFETRWRRQRKKGTCDWIFNTEGFKGWRAMQTSATLCISGKLGSGKTVSMANIVARTNVGHPCAHAFCASQESSSLKATEILGSIALSLLDQLPAEAIAWREAERHNATISSFDAERIIDFVLGLLPKDRTYIVVTDGLEDCSDADMTDVMSGLCRLIKNRTVLLCYSSRSDSRFHHVAKQHLAPEFLVSHDDFNHDAELEAYIVDEVTRRNATRHLSPDLEELVKKQLIIGAQGMYLWASLQLDTIFPANSNVVITDEHILNLITHLPKDLPEAFEQALERISDRQYKGKIMKLVLSAVTPLDLDEVRVALCVVIGEPVWHPEKVAKNGTQLISLCGGNLLDLDEEDGKVRFIHHSVIQHLLSPANSQNTAPYHFTAEDAENFIGATCVTYLHLPVLDSRITVTKNIQGLEVLDTVMETTRHTHPGVGRLVQHIRSREHKRARPSQFDIGHVLSQIQAARVQQDLEPCCFEQYASRNWVFHTRFFDDEVQDCKETWRLWWRLLNGGVAKVMPPCAGIKEDPSTGLLWAVENAHGSLFRNLSDRCDYIRDTDEIVVALGIHKTIHGRWLGSFLTHYLENLRSIDMPLVAERMTLLLDLSANPEARHSRSQSSPLEILTHMICKNALSAEDELELTRKFISHPVVRKSLEDRSLLAALDTLLEARKTVAIAEVLAFRPDLKLGFHKVQTRKTIATPAIEEALNNDRWEEVEDLASQGLVNRPTFAGTTLLWRAIKTKSDAWNYHLLRLGADPNIGPFEMIKHRKGQWSEVSFYPIEAALWFHRTRVCLDLLRFGAEIEQIGDSLMQIARETKNWIMIARLNEVQGRPGRRESSGDPGHRRRGEQHHTALATACQMLSHSVPKEPPGFPRPATRINPGMDWKSELDKIIYRLTLDGDAEYVNAQDADKKTALHYVAEAMKTDPDRLSTLVNILLSRGADPNLADRHGNTPLWVAISNSSPIDSVILPLLKAGADPNTCRPLYGVSIVEEAMITHKGTNQAVMRLVRLLLESGADPRDPLTPESPDSSLITAGSAKGMESLVGDLDEYVHRWSRRQTEGYMI